jgi:hypothetical protein
MLRAPWACLADLNSNAVSPPARCQSAAFVAAQWNPHDRDGGS